MNSRLPAGADDRSAVAEMIRGYRLSQMIAVVATLRIADDLANGPKPVTELAERAACHTDSLYRVMRALAGAGLFEELDGARFRLTPRGELLRRDVSGSLCISAEVVGEPWTWQAWGALLHTVRTGETAFDHVYGTNTWEWFREHAAAGQLFDFAMEEMTSAEHAHILAVYDVAGVRTVVDVAGGSGALLVAVLRSNSSAQGVLFNRPSVIDRARRGLDPVVAPRMRFVAGDFFDAVPPGGDLYILKNILHDWHDEAARAILTTCRRAMNGDARLLIIEQLVGPANQWSGGKLSDVHMMVRTGGRNRTEEEFRALLTATGFRLARTIPPADGPAILEAVALK